MSVKTFDIPLLQDGTVVVVKGTIPPAVDTGPYLNFKANNKDIVFHATTRYDMGGAVGCDSFEYGGRGWFGGSNSALKFDTPKGSRIEIRIRCNPAAFEYCVDGKHYFDYKYQRMMKERITSLDVGNLNDVTVDFEMPQYNSAIRLPTVVEGMKIIGRAYIKPEAERVITQLITQDDENIALLVHCTYGDTNQVSRCSVTSGKHSDWVNTEFGGSSFLVARGTMAKFSFIIRKDCINGIINDRHAFDYKHRIPIEKIKVANFVNYENGVDQTSWRVLMPGESDEEIQTTSQTTQYGRVEIISV